MKYRHEEQVSVLIKQLCQKEEGIMWAERAVKNGISRDHARAIKRMIRIKYEMDYNQMIDDLKDEARAKGLAEGQSEKALEIARKMKEMGDSIEKICAVTGLSFETIETM